MGIFKKEKENFSSEIQKFKIDMITEIKNELQRDNSSNDEFDEVKKDINSLNKNIEENINTINNIKKDLSIVKDKIEAIEAKENEIINEKDNKKENVGEIENIIKNNNDFYFHDMQFMNMHMNVCKIYQCENCHVMYQLNECINRDNEKFKEHILVLQNLENNDDNDNKEKIILFYLSS
jgi:vacuolar-type H+-ATPase subunit I/STV1